MSPVQQIELEEDLLERLAAAAHDAYCEGKLRDGWKCGPVRDDERKIHPLLVPYHELAETYKQANRVTVRNIPRKLAAAGYVMLPSRSNETPLTFPGEDLEELAELEHQLWMEERLANGYTLGEPTKEDPMRNPYLVPWEQVPDEIRQIDRDLIRAIPGILARAGYAIVKVERPSPGNAR